MPNPILSGRFAKAFLTGGYLKIVKKNISFQEVTCFAGYGNSPSTVSPESTCSFIDFTPAFKTNREQLHFPLYIKKLLRYVKNYHTVFSFAD